HVTGVQTCALPIFPDPERADLAVRVDPEPERIEQVARICHHLPAGDHAERVARLTAKEDVLGDGQVRDELKLLVDDADAQCLGVAWAGKMDSLPIEKYGAFEVGMDAAQDLHQG